MRRKLTRRLVIPMLLAGGSLACSSGRESIACPATVEASASSPCVWKLDASTRERRLECTVGGQTFRVDTSGVGEG